MEFTNTRTLEVDKASPSAEVLGRAQLGGFDFDLSLRNARLTEGVADSKLPKAHKTGTTICGVVFKGGVVLGADTRATEGTIVCDKNCEKIHYIAPNIYCCGAGTSADTEAVTRLISSQLELLRLQTGSQSRVVTAMTMLKRRLFRYQGHVSAALVLGGVDSTGPHLYSVYPHGSTDKLPFVTMGSGSLAAMAVMECGFKDDMDEKEAVALVTAAIRSGIFNDLGSGSNVDINVIRAGAAAGGTATAAGGAAGGPASTLQILRNYQTPNEVADLRRRITRPAGRVIPKGATAVIKETFEKHVVVTAVRAEGAGAGAGAGAGGGGGGMSD